MVYIDLRRNNPNIPGPGYLTVDREDFFDPAYEAALPSSPINVYRDKEMTDLFATVHHDGGIDFRR